MIVTVTVVILTSNLAIGVMSGVAISALIFGWKLARIDASTSTDAQGSKVYRIKGQLFFGTMSHFVDLFDVHHDPAHVIIDLHASHVWDHSAVTAIAKIIARYDQQGKRVTLSGLNLESEQLVEQAGLPTRAAS